MKSVNNKLKIDNMKQYPRWILSLAVLLMVFCFVPFLANAQSPCDPSDPACVPIDGGLSLLIAAGVGYGVKKVRDSRKQKQSEEQL